MQHASRKCLKKVGDVTPEIIRKVKVLIPQVQIYNLRV